MLGKNKINKKLRSYIKENLIGGYSKSSIKKVLINHGYNETYIDGLLKKHSELQFVKKYAFFASLLFIVSFFAFNLFNLEHQNQKLTGYAANAKKYFVLDVNYIGGSVAFNKITLRELNAEIENTDKSGFLIKVLSFDNAVLESIHLDMPADKNYIIYIPYSENAATIEVYNLKNSKIMDIDVSSFSNSKEGQQQAANLEGSNKKPNYWVWALSILIAIVLLIFFAKKRKEGKIIDSLKQYIDEGQTRGFTLQQIKDALIREGYTQKEVDNAIKFI